MSPCRFIYSQLQRLGVTRLSRSDCSWAFSDLNSSKPRGNYLPLIQLVKAFLQCLFLVAILDSGIAKPTCFCLPNLPHRVSHGRRAQKEAGQVRRPCKLFADLCLSLAEVHLVCKHFTRTFAKPRDLHERSTSGFADLQKFLRGFLNLL